MITAIIIDDEPHCIERLSNLIENNFFGEVTVIGRFSSFAESVKAIKELKPELVFLDVQIDKHKTGFDLLEQIDNIQFDVIFTTAFEKYAVQAFRISAIDYLLKPVDKDYLGQAINKLKAKYSPNQFPEKLDVLFHNLKNVQGFSKRICIPVMNGYEVFQINNIIRCESSVNYTTLFIKDNRKLTVAKTLKEFEDMLGAYNFFRVHNSHLINMNYIKTYNKSKGGFVVLTDNSVIEVSVRRKDDFFKKLAEM
jgi:two-component system LytT family response regulator